jgi:hypothetical protein
MVLSSPSPAMWRPLPDKARKPRVIKDAAYYREWREKDKARKAENARPVADLEEVSATANNSVAPVASKPDAVAFEPAMSAPEVRFEAKRTESKPDGVEPAPIDIFRPPKRLPARSKGRWQTLPDWLREDVIAREVEFDTAFSRYDGLGNYALTAERNGTTLQAAFASYVQLEDEFRKDPIGGAVAAWMRLGFDPGAVVAEMFRRLDAAAQPQQPAAPAITEQCSPNSAPIRATSSPGPSEPIMRQLLASGQTKTLFEAYEAACTMSPIVQEVQMGRLRQNDLRRNVTPIDRARMAAKATVGAPSSGKREPAREAGQHESVEETVRAALRRQHGG